MSHDGDSIKRRSPGKLSAQKLSLNGGLRGQHKDPSFSHIMSSSQPSDVSQNPLRSLFRVSYVFLCLP
jgi:hypothetical protein